MSDVLLAKKWENEDPTGWWISEKLDGVRAVWRNGEFCSRGDNTFACPEWFKRKMPAGCVLDGELWGGRGQFQKTVGITRSSSRHDEWKFLTYMVFDCLQEGGANIEHKPFETRLEAIKRICATVDQNEAALKAVPMERCANRESLAAALADVEKRGGEGLMLRCPGSRYEHRRSKTLLKVKTFYDEEAIVVGHAGGTGRVAGWCGALLCETPDKRRFKVGSGLSDAQRQDPPVINAVITYRYQELTADNIPRFPTLVGERTDMTWSQICATYVPPRARKDMALKKTHSILFDDAQPCATGASVPSGGPPAPVLKRGLSIIDGMQRGTAEEDLDDFGFEDMMPPVPPPEKKPRQSSSEVAATLQTASEKSMCPFGRRCYRKNPAHFLEFQHPWRDEQPPYIFHHLPSALDCHGMAPPFPGFVSIGKGHVQVQTSENQHFIIEPSWKAKAALFLRSHPGVEVRDLTHQERLVVEGAKEAWAVVHYRAVEALRALDGQPCVASGRPGSARGVTPVHLLLCARRATAPASFVTLASGVAGYTLRWSAKLTPTSLRLAAATMKRAGSSPSTRPCGSRLPTSRSSQMAPSIPSSSWISYQGAGALEAKLDTILHDLANDLHCAVLSLGIRTVADFRHMWASSHDCFVELEQRVGRKLENQEAMRERNSSVGGPTRVVMASPASASPPEPSPKLRRLVSSGVPAERAPLLVETARADPHAREDAVKLSKLEALFRLVLDNVLNLEELGVTPKQLEDPMELQRFKDAVMAGAARLSGPRLGALCSALRRWLRFCLARAVDPRSPSPLLLREVSVGGPTAASSMHASLKWFASSFGAAFPMEHWATKHYRFHAVHHAGKQMLELQPWELVNLVLLMKRSQGTHRVLVAQMLMAAIGCIRFEHLQRSKFVAANGPSLEFFCSQGKARKQGARPGYGWGLPHLTLDGQGVTQTLRDFYANEFPAESSFLLPAVALDPEEFWEVTEHTA
eukprot:s1483_g9.t1